MISCSHILAYMFTLFSAKKKLTFCGQTSTVYLVIVLWKFEEPAAEGAHTWAHFYNH